MIGVPAALVVALAVIIAVPSPTAASRAGNADGLHITNVSYDPTRDLYQAYNESFKEHYREKTGQEVEITQSHGGSGSQARSVLEGAQADVVTLALEHDISILEDALMLDPGWLGEFPNDSAPYTSTIVFLVRKGNPKGLNDWDDLLGEGVGVITPDPKSSGGACWNFLAAWEYARQNLGDDEEKIKQFMHDLYANVAVMDSGARGATTTFVENGQGDVLIAWENEAIQSVKSYPDEFEIVTPSVSILAQPTVAVVDENARKDHAVELATEYLDYLYSDEAQRIEAENGYRPSNQDILAQYGDVFDLNVDLCSIADFGGWDAAYDKFFKEGALFDQIYQG